MKKIINVLIFIVLLVTIDVKAVGSIDVSPTSLTIEKNSSKKIQITGSNSAGVVVVTSSNNAIASLSATTSDVVVAIENGYRIFIDKGTVDLSVIGKESGTATINVYIEDAATYDVEDLSGQTKRVNVTVTMDATPTPTATSQVSVTPTPTPTSQVIVTPTPTPFLPDATFTPTPVNTPNNSQVINNVPKTDLNKSVIIYIFVILLLLTGIGFIIYYNYNKNKTGE